MRESLKLISFRKISLYLNLRIHVLINTCINQYMNHCGPDVEVTIVFPDILKDFDKK